MNPAEPSSDSDANRCPIELNLAAAKLEVYEYERLAYTEMPVVRPRPKSAGRHLPTLLSAMCHWVLSRL